MITIIQNEWIKIQNYTHKLISLEIHEISIIVG